ncbi:MAG: nuclear transport factor 2 family protein [Planctomycetota bacterium]|jgi:hypothetical protein
MKKYIIILILLAIMPVLGFGKENPEDVLIKYFKSLYSNNLKKTYNYISKTDKNTISRNEFINQNTLDDPFAQEMAKMINSSRNYKINETKIDADSAIVDITIIAPDMSKVLGEIFGPFHGPKDMKNPQEAMRHMLRQYLKKADVPMIEERGNLTLVKEEGKWKVLLNLKNEN